MKFKKPVKIGSLKPSTKYNITIIAVSVEDKDIKSDAYIVPFTTNSSTPSEFSLFQAQ